MVMNTPRTSIILPVYNGERFIEAALHSIQIQDVDLEVLAHDDGSTDNTRCILDRLSRDDGRILVSRSPNSGPATARNLCLRRAKGDFIAFMDHDDLWPEGRLARQLDILSRSPKAGGILGHTVIFDKVDDQGKPADSQSNRLVLAGLLQAGLFRRAAIEATGDFDPSLRAADDFDFLLRLIESGGRLDVDPGIAVFYRQHPRQWTANLTQTGLQTARALQRSLHRRRSSGVARPLSWRIDDEQTPL